jgi:pyruvate formate-lyase/glycerol dehydratase family glycyl radical enzyme
MSKIIDVDNAQHIWGTFDGVREHLYDQFQNIQYDLDTGLSIKDLENEVETYLQNHPDHPKVLQKANIFRISLTHSQICIDPVDWFASNINHGNFVNRIRDKWHGDVRNTLVKDEAMWSDRMYNLGVMRGGLDMHHIAPGWENMFSGGLMGLVEQIHRCRQNLGAEITDEQLSFYEAVEICYLATISLAKRFSVLALRMASDYPEHEQRLNIVADVCNRVPAYSPRTFHEALQFIWFMQIMIEIEGESPMSLGHFDRMLYPYYRNDIDSGLLTPEQAKELIKFFWYKYHARMRGRGDSARNFTFAGQCPDGTDAVNELTYLALDAREELNAPDPKLSVRFFPGSPDNLYRCVVEKIRNGSNSMVLMNDMVAVEALIKRGKTPEDARSYLSIGCYEPAIDGKEAACTMNMPINMAKILELTLNDGIDPLSNDQVGPHTGDPRQFNDFEQLFDAYITQLDFILTRSAESIITHERQWMQINPSPLIAGTIDDCLARGKDIGEGGAHYNSIGSIGVALANTCDSLLALKQAVFEEKLFSIDEVLTALKCDFDGYEPMRQYLLNRIPKWGNNDPETNDLARRLADHYCDKVHTFTNSRGGKFQAALFALGFQWIWGKVTGALLDGRKAHTPLAPGVGATPGQDKKGVTALLGSVTNIDFTKTPDGSVLDIMLHPSAIKGEDGLNAIVALIKSFFSQGGYALQFNIVDTETLREAQLHPEQYAHLQIRVSGYSAYFTNLSKYEQDLFIARNTHIV